MISIITMMRGKSSGDVRQKKSLNVGSSKYGFIRLPFDQTLKRKEGRKGGGLMMKNMKKRNDEERGKARQGNFLRYSRYLLQRISRIVKIGLGGKEGGRVCEVVSGVWGGAEIKRRRRGRGGKGCSVFVGWLHVGRARGSGFNHGYHQLEITAFVFQITRGAP